MDDTGFCSHCGKLVDQGDFNFCPYCGSKQKNQGNWQKLLDECLAPLEIQERTILLDRLLTLSSKIDSLDGEIQAFIKGKTPQPVR